MNELEEYIHIPKISKNINFWMLRIKEVPSIMST